MTKKIAIPMELKYDFAMGGYSSFFRGVMNAIRETCGAAVVLEIIERHWKKDDRIKRLTNTIRTIFKLEGNDAETIAQWWDIWYELVRTEYTWLELSKTKARCKITKCPWKTDHKDISDWPLIFMKIVAKTINPKATVERPIGMCAGDPYCEYIWKIEE